MGILDWLKSLLKRAPRRNVSRLGDESQDLDLVEEVIRDDGGPLKPGHRRRILRDQRLLPKKRRPTTGLLRRKRKKLMPREEADRLFAATMRTRNRQIRDLLPDEQQLVRFGLPLWKTEADVAAALDISVGQLRHYSIHRDAETVPHYVTFAIPKRNGDQRLIMAPKKRLKALQRRLLDLLVNKLPVSEYAHGFRSGRSIRTGAAPHVGKKVVVKVDLRDFFPSVTFPRVRGLLISLGYDYAVATTLAVLMTEAERQPVDIDGRIVHVPVGPRHCVQGAPTSPGICNAIARKLDHRLAGAAKRLEFVYTRYADDMTFSADDATQVKALLGMVGRIGNAEGFQLNRKKTRVSRSGQRQEVTGVTVNHTLGLSRQHRRRLRAAIHRMRANAAAEDAGTRQRQLRGKLAYLAMLNPEQAEPLLKQLHGS